MFVNKSVIQLKKKNRISDFFPLLNKIKNILQSNREQMLHKIKLQD